MHRHVAFFILFRSEGDGEKTPTPLPFCVLFNFILLKVSCFEKEVSSATTAVRNELFFYT